MEFVVNLFSLLGMIVLTALGGIVVLGAMMGVAALAGALIIEYGRLRRPYQVLIGIAVLVAIYLVVGPDRLEAMAEGLLIALAFLFALVLLI